MPVKKQQALAQSKSNAKKQRTPGPDDPEETETSSTNLIHALFDFGPIFLFFLDVHIVVSLVSSLLIALLVLSCKHCSEDEDQNGTGEDAARDDDPRNVISEQRKRAIRIPGVRITKGTCVPGLVFLLPHERTSSISKRIPNQDQSVSRRPLKRMSCQYEHLLKGKLAHFSYVRK